LVLSGLGRGVRGLAKSFSASFHPHNRFHFKAGFTNPL